MRAGRGKKRLRRLVQVNRFDVAVHDADKQIVHFRSMLLNRFVETHSTNHLVIEADIEIILALLPVDLKTVQRSLVNVHALFIARTVAVLYDRVLKIT